MSLSPMCRETYWSKVRRWTVRKCQILIITGTVVEICKRCKLCTIHLAMMTMMIAILLTYETVRRLTPSMPAVPNCCCLKGSAPHWPNPPLLISDIRALYRSALRARVPECQKLKMVGKTRTAKYVLRFNGISGERVNFYL